MKVQVAKWGNSTAVRLPKAVVKQLGLTPGMTLDVSVEEGAISMTVVSGDDQALPPQGRPEPYPVTLEWMIEEAERLGGIENAPRDDVDWGPDVGSEVIYDDYNPQQAGILSPEMSTGSISAQSRLVGGLSSFFPTTRCIGSRRAS